MLYPSIYSTIVDVLTQFKQRSTHTVSSDFTLISLRVLLFIIVGMALGYIVLTTCYYNNVFNGRDILWMSQSLFNNEGGSYNQSAILTPQNTLDSSKLDSVGLPRYTTTYAISQMCYNFSLGAAIVHVLLWNWPELTRAFGKMRFMRSSQDIDDPHYQGAYWVKGEVVY